VLRSACYFLLLYSIKLVSTLAGDALAYIQLYWPIELELLLTDRELNLTWVIEVAGGVILSTRNKQLQVVMQCALRGIT
jgi:hypothetical protein